MRNEIGFRYIVILSTNNHKLGNMTKNCSVILKSFIIWQIDEIIENKNKI